MLNHTPAEITERQALRINPSKTCQPIGAMYAALGIHGCLPHSHGSQGCCAYHRSHLTRHFREPVMAATSSFTEGASVFGGMANLTQAIHNIFAVYNPDVIAINTTCLSETIGDDLQTVIRKAEENGSIPAGKHVFYANTPSYIGSHVTGFANMVKAMADKFAERSDRHRRQVNVVPGYVEPADMRELKRYLRILGVPCVMFPDVSDVLDTPKTGKFTMFPPGGVTVDALRTTGDSVATLALGSFASTDAALALEKKCQVPQRVLDLPIGIAATDRFIQSVRDIFSIEVPSAITDERGRLVDAVADMHQYLYGKRVALFGDPDQVIALGEFLTHLGMKVVHAVTGTPGYRFERRMAEVIGHTDVAGGGTAHIRAGGDLSCCTSG